MYDIDYVKEHFNEFEEDTLLDRRFTKRFIEFLPLEEWEQYDFSYIGEDEYIQKEWTEENILKQLKEDVEFGYSKAEDERGISAELMAMVVNAWCKVLQNELNLDGNDGWYHIKQFTIVANHYGWEL